VLEALAAGTVFFPLDKTNNVPRLGVRA